MDGPQRALLYEVALTTGLRWSELRSVKVKDLSLDSRPPTIHVGAENTKNGDEAVQPIPPHVASKLKDHTAFRMPEADVFDMWIDKGAEMVKWDLEGTRDKEKNMKPIPYKDDQGRIADFHSLRHAFCTHLAEAGTPPHTLMKLARHADISTP
jgi:integrase